MERHNKYLVLKTSDINNALTEQERGELAHIRSKIILHRKKLGRKLNKAYVVVSETLPFYEETWKKIEEYVDNQRDKISDKGYKKTTDLWTDPKNGDSISVDADSMIQISSMGVTYSSRLRFLHCFQGEAVRAPIKIERELLCPFCEKKLVVNTFIEGSIGECLSPSCRFKLPLMITPEVVYELGLKVYEAIKNYNKEGK